MPTPVLNNIEVFKTTVQVMLEDGVLTREEKRLVIKRPVVLARDAFA